MLVGGRKRERQRFELRAATAQSLMLLLATVALVMPAIFQLVAGGGLPDPTAKAVAFPSNLQALSVGVAVYFAVRDRMDISVNIAVGSAAQIALFVAPVLVLLSLFVGPFPMALVFNGFEVASVLLAVLVALSVTRDGTSTWFEGVQLLAVYCVLGVVFFFV